MIQRFLLIVSLSVSIGSSASAAGPETQCMPITKIKKELANYTFTPLTRGQFHFAQGVYVGSPVTPPGLPPGDGAILIQRSPDKDGLIIWTRGPLACGPLPIPEALVKLLSSIRAGSVDSDGDEL
jgi:hypothetical protein